MCPSPSRSPTTNCQEPPLPFSPLPLNLAHWSLALATLISQYNGLSKRRRQRVIVTLVAASLEVGCWSLVHKPWKVLELHHAQHLPSVVVDLDS
eukprot:m.428952 g.428952  ORF g.428952 m.428952 type:complete len:94 (+) comp16917_c0_seq1:2245-2526(+)